ncbi:hypothetical protein [Micromonospora sp. NPDC048887]|uniref:hypothetical protein n=1 Tax=unclassified Micromonospora TaxID=2617518 RepID=UPI003400ED1B
MESAHRRRVEAPLNAKLDVTGLGRQRQATSRDTRKRRHAGLFEAVRRLDGHLDAGARAELAKWVRDEYEREFGDVPLGFVATCYLGPPYVDHRLDLFHSIVEHYAPGDVMPEPFAQARMLARTGAYAYIEVYAGGTLHPVLPDGSVVGGSEGRS